MWIKKILLLLIVFILLALGCSNQETSEQQVNVDSETCPIIDRNPDEENDLISEDESEANESEVNEVNEVDKLDIDFITSTPEEIIEALDFMVSPIKGAKVTEVDGQLPNAPRRYRNGYHEGLDYYGNRGTKIQAVADGEIIRADHDFIEMTLEEYENNISISMNEPITPEEILDKLRGMQVWILHDNGVVTRYAHLDSINNDLIVGERIKQGDNVGEMGNSGTKSAVVGEILSPSSSPHLHFEVWLDDIYLGKEREPKEVRKIYSGIFD